MLKKSIFKKILIFVFIFVTVFSFSVSHGTKIRYDKVSNGYLTKEQYKEKLLKDQTDNAWEMTISGYALNIGDMLMDYCTFMFSDEITIDRLVYNRVISLDANFFEENGFAPTSTKVLKDIINDWYALFRGLAVIAYLIVLVMIGIKILLGAAEAKAMVSDLVVKWTLGVAILFLFPYVMKYAFILNDSIVTEIYNSYSENPYSEIVGTYIGNISDVQYDQVFEERSPEYISQSDYVYNLGSAEATYSYFNQLEKYKGRTDVMRIMRAMAGITAKFIYVILWYIMLFQLLALAFVYTKRYLMIAFLIIIFPITVIEYIIGTVKTGKGGGITAWCMEFFLNVFIQTIHAVIYGVIGSVVMLHVRNSIVQGDIQRMNWVILIISVNFLFEGEKIVKKIIKANAESLRSGDEVLKGAKRARVGAVALGKDAVAFGKGTMEFGKGAINLMSDK